MKRKLLVPCSLALLSVLSLAGCSNPYPNAISLDEAITYVSEMDSQTYSYYDVSYSNYFSADQVEIESGSNEGTINNIVFELPSSSAGVTPSRIFGAPLHINATNFTYDEDKSDYTAGVNTIYKMMVSSNNYRDQVIVEPTEDGGISFNTYGSFISCVLLSVYKNASGSYSNMQIKGDANIEFVYNAEGNLIKEKYTNVDFYRDDVNRKFECFVYYTYHN